MNKNVKEIMNQETSKSKKMVALYNEGLEIKEVAELMGTRYQFAYNVISNYCRMNDLEIRTAEKGESKKDIIIKLCDEGKSNVEIQKELKCSYNYVFNTVKEYLRTKQA